MVPRDVRLTPLPLRAALLLLAPLALLGTLLLGLLAQSATAEHAVTPPSITGAPTDSEDAAPTWTYTLPAAGTVGPTPTTEPATGTVTINRTYTGECAFTRVDPAPDTAYTSGAPCNVVFGAESSYTGAVDTDGAYYFSVRTVELEESTFTPDVGSPTTTTTTHRSAPASSTFVYDGNAPVVTLTGPTGGASRSPAFSVGIQDATGTTPACSVDGTAAVTSCGLGTNGIVLDLTGEVDGTYTVTVSTTDAGGRTTTKTATYVLDSFTLDVTGPTTGSSSTPSWSVTAPGATGFTCNIIGPGSPSITLCDDTGVTASLPTTGTTGASYTLTVDATDGLNTASTTETYLLDNRVDAVVLGPTSPGVTRTPTWTVDAGEPVEVLSCTLKTGTTVVVDNGVCTDAGYTADELPSGDGTPYLVELEVRDALGTVQTLTSPVYVLDDTPATLTLVPGQDATDNDASPSWTFTGDTWSNVGCTLTTGTTEITGGSCGPTGYSAPGLAPTAGTDYLLTVTGTDSVGNPVQATATYTLDTIAELVTTPPASPSNDVTPVWSFVTESGAAVTCSLTGPGANGGSCTTTGFEANPLPTSSGASYVLTVTVTDALGNVTPYVMTAYVLDTDAVAGFTAQPPAVGSSATPSWSYTVENGSTVSCSFAGPSATGGSCSTTGFTANALPPSPGADYVLTVTVVDARGNTTTLTGTYRLDSVAVLTSATFPASPGADTSPTWTWSTEADVTATCRLVDDFGTVLHDGACTTESSFTPPTDLSGTSGTTYTLTVTVVDALGNSATTPMPDYRLDTVSDVSLVSAPPTPGNDRSPTWTWTAETGSSATCVLRNAANAIVFNGACSSPTAFTSADLPPTTGTTYTLTVTVLDALGNSTTLIPPSYRLDTIAELVVGSAPATPGNDRRPTWTWTAEAGSTLTCVLRDAPTGAPVYSGACTTAGSFTPSADLPSTSGTTYTLRVTVVDGVGNSSTTTLPIYYLDTTADATVTAPVSPSRDATPSWTWTAEPGTTVDCALSGPGAAGGTCDATGFTASPLPPTTGGDYVLTVTFTDGVGNETVYVSGVFHLDTVAELSPGTAPSSPGSTRTPTWTWTAEGGATVTCVLRNDANAVVHTGACSTASSFTSATLPPTSGTTYTLTVTVVDVLGNSTTTAMQPYLLDTIADVAAAGSPQSPGNDTSPTWTWTIEDAATVTCRLVSDTGTVVADGPCSSRTSFTSADLPGTSGTTYTLTLTVVDALGNTTTLALPGYRLDTVADVVIGAGPATPGNDTSPTWSFTAEVGSTVVCAFTGPGAGGGVCDRSGFTATPLSPTTGATYGLTITVTDALGNVTTRVLSAYVLDTIAEFAAGDAPPSPGNDTSPTWTWTAEAGSTVTCVLRTAPTGAPVYSGPCTTAGSFTPPTALPATSGTTYTLRVTVVDALGNSTTTTLPTYLLDTTSDVTAVASPASPGNDVSPTWTWTVESGSSASCVLVDDQGTVVFDDACTTATTFDSADLPGTSGTTYTLTITVVDALGNSTTTALPTYRLDTIADFAAGASPPTPGNDTSPTWTWSAEASSTVTCVLRDDANAVVFTGACSTAGSFTSATLPATSGTTYTLTVTVVDALGNSTTTTLPTYRLDTIADFATGDAPTTPDNDTTPTWTWTSEPGSAVTCVLTAGAGTVVFTGACSTADSFTATALPGTSGTTYTLTVTVVDALGNRTTTTLPAFDLDTVSDVTPLLAPATPDHDTTPTWTWDAEDGATAACVLEDDTGAVVFDDACTTSTSFTADALTGTTGTTYTLTITVTDVLGNTTTTTLPVYLLDTVLELDVVGPTGPSPVRAPVWSFTAEPLTTLVCTLTGPDGLVISGGICDQNGYRAPPLVEDGDYVLTVRGVDAAGNDVTQTFGYDLDTLHFSIDGPTGPSPDRSPTWTFTDEAYVSADCVLTGPDGVVFDGPCTTTSSFTAGDLPLTPGADYVLTVTVVDSIGNVGTLSSAPYRLDTQLPVATITVPTSPSRVVTVTWVVAADEPLLSATCELRRNGVVVLSLANCPGSTTVTLPGDGRYDLVVTLVDLAGNSSTTTSTVLVHDATTPVAPVVSPTAVTTNRTTATWTITAEGGSSVTTCRVLRDGAVFADWATCGATFTLPLGADGSYVLEVVSTDPVGPGPTTSVTYLLDTRAPVAPALTGPTGPSPNRAPSWSVSTGTGTSVECRLLRAGTVVLGWAPCAGTFGADLTGLPDGGYVLEARATDLAGNVSPVGSSSAYVLDTTAPVAVVVTGPSGPSQLRSPVFTWSGEAGARAECQLSRDGVVVGGWVACTPGYSPVLDRDGTWTLTVRLTDAAGNVSEPATSGGYVLDTTAPPTPVVTPPQTPGRELAPSWGVIVESGASTECRLTGPDGVTGAWAPCTLPHVTSLTGRPDGAYVLEVRATDVAGNISPVGSGTYVLDTVAPDAAVITAPASPSRTRIPTFTFTVEPGSSTRCRLTSGSTLINDYVACSGSFTVDLTGLPDGTYTVTVRVSDAAGNPGPAATGTYVLDTTGPAAPVLVTSPASPSPSRSATWAFSYEPGATLVCRLTFPTGAVREIAGCASPLTIDLTGLPDGTYTLTVRAVDAAGNVGAALSDTHVIDSTALAPPIVTGPVTPGTTRTPSWTFSSASATECRLTRGTTVLIDWTSCATQYVAALFNQPDGTYTLSVRSIVGDEVSAAATSRYVLDTTGPGAATIVAPPTPSTNLHPVWTIASAELGATAECRVLYFGSVLRDWAPCVVSPEGALFDELDLTDATDGTYTLVVRLIDAVGNRSAVETSSVYVLDTSAPVGVGVTGPPSPGNDRSPTWTFTTAGDLVLECRLTSDAVVISDWDTCVDSFTADLSEQPDGVYNLSVRAVSEAGTPGPETTVQYVLSTVAPDGPTLLVLSGTKPVDNDRTPTWTFTLPDGTTGRCVLTAGARVLADAVCKDSFSFDLSGERDGSFTLTVYAIDEAGTPSEPATSTYRLDVSAPAVPTFTLVPGGPASTLTVQWRFTTAYGSTPECRVRFGDAVGEWGACTSLTSFDLDLSLRPDGEYVLEVRAVDDAGNSSAPRPSTYVLDRSAAPIATFTSTPDSPGTDRTVVWTFTAPEGYTLECRLLSPDGATAWEPCSSTTAALRVAGSLVVGSTGRYSLDLANRRDGEYVLEVRVVDATGVRGSASRATYVRDTTPPVAPTFSDTPPPAGNDPLPSWSWDAATDDQVQCRLLRNGVEISGWTACTSFSQRLTSQGTYRLEIRRVDLAGNASGVTASEYVYDTTPPSRPVLSGPPSSGSDRTVSWTFAVPDGATATCTVKRGLNQVDERTCTSGRYDLDLSGQPDGTYTLTVRFTDAAGNPGPSASGSYALRTVGLPGRVVPPPPTSGPAPSAPSGPGRGGTGVVVIPPQGSTPDPGVPTTFGEDDVIPRDVPNRVSTAIPSTDGEEAAGGSTTDDAPSAGRDPLVADPFPFDKLAPVIREAVTGTITRPTLPLALLAIVVLFLLAQNRIDRRDPKLASAPVEAEPELDFTLIVRRPGGALS